MQIMTHDMDTFIMDTRYQPVYDKTSDTWELRIVRAKPSDSGVYECQLSSLPVLSYPVQLHVVLLQLQILGDEELFVQTDSSLTLTCVVQNLAVSLVWSHDGQVLSVGTSTSVGTENSTSTSELWIGRVLVQHAGYYTCGYRTHQDTIRLHVLHGERTHSLHTSPAPSQGAVVTVVTSFTLFVHFCYCK